MHPRVFVIIVRVKIYGRSFTPKACARARSNCRFDRIYFFVASTSANFPREKISTTRGVRSRLCAVTIIISALRSIGFRAYFNIRGRYSCFVDKFFFFLMSTGALELKYFSFGTAGKKVLSKYDFVYTLYLLELY